MYLASLISSLSLCCRRPPTSKNENDEVTPEKNVCSRVYRIALSIQLFCLVVFACLWLWRPICCEDLSSASIGRDFGSLSFILGFDNGPPPL